MSKKKVYWKMELALSKKGKKKKMVSFDIAATDEQADNILDILIRGYEEIGFTVGGGIVRVRDE